MALERQYRVQLELQRGRVLSKQRAIHNGICQGEDSIYSITLRGVQDGVAVSAWALGCA